MTDIRITPEDNHFECLLISAVRYCIGRRTYMPEAVTVWIMGNCKGKLSKKTVSVMIRDIDEAHGLGDKCDVETWMRFRKWLTEQEAHNGEA